MKYATRRRKSAAVKRGKRKNLKNRRRTKKVGGMMGRAGAGMMGSQPAAEPSKFDEVRFNGMLLEMLKDPSLGQDIKNKLQEIFRDDRVSDPRYPHDREKFDFNWANVFQRLSSISKLRNTAETLSANKDGVQVLINKLSPKIFEIVMRHPNYEKGRLLPGEMGWM
jgi:hypothetical protein